MSNEWIERLAKNVRIRAENHKTERELRLQAAPLIRANSMALWHSLADTVQRDIDKINLVFTGHDRRTLVFGEEQGQKFVVRKAVLLATTLEVELNQEGQRISFQYIRTLDHHTPQSASSSGSLEIEMDPSDQLLCLSHQGRLFFNMDEVSWFLLAPIFEYL